MRTACGDVSVPSRRGGGACGAESVTPGFLLSASSGVGRPHFQGLWKPTPVLPLRGLFYSSGGREKPQRMASEQRMGRQQTEIYTTGDMAVEAHGFDMINKWKEVQYLLSKGQGTGRDASSKRLYQWGCSGQPTLAARPPRRPRKAARCGPRRGCCRTAVLACCCTLLQSHPFPWNGMASDLSTGPVGCAWFPGSLTVSR